MIVSSDIIASIAHDLSRSQEAKRAKKLIFYVSQRYWESDFAVVNSYSFEALLQSLYENNPTLFPIEVTSRVAKRDIKPTYNEAE